MHTLFQKLVSGLIGISLIIVTPIASFLGLHVEKPQPNPSPTYQVQEQATSQNLGAYNPTGGGTYHLQSSIGLTNTSINLSSFKEPISNIPYTMTYLNSSVAYGTLDPQNPTRSEFISFTGITQNSDGSAKLTGVIRGLARSYPYTASSSLAVSHSGQSIFILSDSPQHFLEYAVKRNDETITGAWSFPTPSSASNAATKQYVDSAITGTTTISTDKLIVSGTAGESVSAGNLLYLKTSDGKWYKANGSISTTTLGVQLGLAEGTGSTGVTISGGVLLHGLDTNQSGLTTGSTYYASTTLAGAIGTVVATSTPGIGNAKSATNLYFSPLQFNSVGLNTDSSISGTITYSGGATVFASSSLITYTASSTWSKPANLKYIVIEVVGGGGGGGGANTAVSTDSGGGGGGGGGGYCRNILSAAALSATSTVSVTLGGGGTAGAATGTNGGTGGTSSFSTFCSATGGVGGTGVTNGIGAGGAGGTGSLGMVSLDGNGGGAGFGDTAIDYAMGGIGGASFFGGAAKSVGGTGAGTLPGVAGTKGGGGSGASSGANTDNVGGVGGPGFAIITQYFY